MENWFWGTARREKKFQKFYVEATTANEQVRNKLTKNQREISFRMIRVRLEEVNTDYDAFALNYTR